eukprot:gene14327-biopygen8716
MPPEAPVWSAHFEHALEAILRSLQHTDDALRECGMTCTKDFIRAQPQRFRAFTEHVPLRLLAAGRDSTPFIARSMQVATAAEETIAILLSVSDAHRCMAVLVRAGRHEGESTYPPARRANAVETRCEVLAATATFDSTAGHSPSTPHSVSPPSSTTLECLLPQLLFYAQEPRNDIREIAHGSLKAVEMAYTADGVLPFVLRAMDDSTPRIRVSALTFMSKCLHVAPQCAHHGPCQRPCRP